jgi:hypothetical protein
MATHNKIHPKIILLSTQTTGHLASKQSPIKTQSLKKQEISNPTNKYGLTAVPPAQDLLKNSNLPQSPKPH